MKILRSILLRRLKRLHLFGQRYLLEVKVDVRDVRQFCLNVQLVEPGILKLNTAFNLSKCLFSGENRKVLLS